MYTFSIMTSVTSVVFGLFTNLLRSRYITLKFHEALLRAYLIGRHSRSRRLNIVLKKWLDDWIEFPSSASSS